MNAMKSFTLALAILGSSWPGMPTFARTPLPSPMLQTARVVTTTDPATGVKVRLTTSGSTRFLVEVADDLVSIKKSTSPSSALTTISVPGETLTVALASGRLAVTGRGGSLQIDGTTPDAVRRLVTYLKQSVAVQAARVLLSRMDLRSETTVGRSLLITRALLDSTVGRFGDAVAQARLISRRQGTVTLPARFGAASLDACWDTYHRESLSMTADLQTCLKDAAWWNTVEQGLCGAIYAIEAEAAFGEYLLCVAHLLDTN